MARARNHASEQAPGEDAIPRMHCMEVWGGNGRVDRAFLMPGLQAWIYSQPFGQSEEGGDVYYVSSCASGRITRLLLADVSGHGPDVSDLAVGLRDLMRGNVNVVKQTRFVEGMNQQFTRLSQSGAFATALVATYFQPTHRLTLCNAGHPAPLHYDHSESSWSRIEGPPSDTQVVTGTPLGVHDQASYPQVEIDLDRGDMMLLFSDALTEAEGERGKMLGEDGLLQLVRHLAPEPAQEFIRSLVDAVKGVRPRDVADDDMTIVLIQATATKTRWRDNLLALFRLLRQPTDRTRLKLGTGKG